MYHPQKDIEKCCIYKKAAPSYHGNQKLDSKNLSSRREQNRMRYTVEQLIRELEHRNENVYKLSSRGK